MTALEIHESPFQILDISEVHEWSRKARQGVAKKRKMLVGGSTDDSE